MTNLADTNVGKSVTNQPVAEGWISRTMRKRYSIGMMFALLFWPFAGFVSTFEAILRNGLLIDTYRQLVFLTFVNAVAFFFCIAIQRLLNSRFPGGWWQAIFSDGSQPWGAKRILGTLGLAAVTPAILAIFFGEEFSTTSTTHVFSSMASIIAGLAGAWVVLLLVGELKCRLFGSDAATQNYFPFEARNRRGFKFVGSFLNLAKSIAKWFRLDKIAAWLGVERIDTQFLTYLVVLAGVHWGTARGLSESETWLTSAPAMVVLLIWIAGMAISGIANAFDRFRLPVVALVLLLLTVWLSLFGSTRDIQTSKDNSSNGFVAKIAAVSKAESDFLARPLMERKMSRVELVREQTADLEEAAWNAIVARMDRVRPVDPKKGKTLVVVTCPGGGIHAAAWSACVLDRLSTEYAEFEDSVCLISGVSGGSVGTLMFVSSRYDAELTNRKMVVGAPMPTTEEIHDAIKEKSPALELAARSSLEQIAYGISADDLYGLIYPPLAISGRGQRLEDSFSNRLPALQEDLTMGDWGDRAVDGTVPIVVFNSTDAVSGRRVLFDTIPTPRRASSVGLTSRPLNYRELLSVKNGTARDVKPATAARTSATFPYVSPFTKPDEASLRGEAVAICDGGYVDNEGIVSAVNWIEFLLKRWSAIEPTKRPFDRILLLRIEPAYSDDRNQVPDSGGLAGWLRWISGPAETMVKVRSASQLERGNLESDLAALYLELNTGDSRDGAVETATQTQPTLLGNPFVQESADGNPTLVEKADFQRQNASPEANRKDWNALVDQFQERLKTDDKPRVQGTFRPTPSDEIDVGQPNNVDKLPVIVQSIRFENADQVIPLNWKLSKKQKLWYLLAWERCSDEGTKLKSTLTRLFSAN